MKPLLLLAVALTLLQAPLRAQPGPAITSPIPAPPLDALLTAAARFESYANYSCHLVSRLLDRPGATADTGTCHFSGTRYHLDYEADEMICDGKQVMVWSKEFGEVAIQPHSPSDDMTLPGIYRLYQKRYTVAWGDSTDKARTVVLTARDAGMGFPRATITLDRKSGLITTYTLLIEPLGTFQYEVRDVEVNADLPESLFTIDWDFVDRVRRGEVPPEEHHH